MNDSVGSVTDTMQDAVDNAEQALSEAEANTAAAEQALEQTKEDVGQDIADDVTGTSTVRDDDAKDGDAAIQVSGDTTIVSGGDVTGSDGGALTIDTDGTTNIQAEGDVNIQSSEDVNIDNITAGGDVDVTANGDITGTGSDPVITGDSVTLDAISTGDDTSTIGGENGKPLDVDAVASCIEQTGKIVTVEDHNILNGLGSAVAEVMAECGKGKLKRVGVLDQFGQSAPYERLLEMNGITAENVAVQAEKLLK